MEFPSKLVEEAVEAFSQLPGIGKKTALRLVLHLLKENPEFTEQFSDAVAKMRREIRFCKVCHNISDEEVCQICSNSMRKHDTVCVVEDFRDVIAIESTQQYRGTYHVLDGLISPMEGIGPEDLYISELVQRVEEKEVKEIIMALSPTIEGDTTIFYISKKLKDKDVKLTTIARGVAFGGELEYADEMTLARSIENRLPYDNYLAKQEESSKKNGDD